MTKRRIHVVAGVLRDADGQVLLAQRRAGTHLEGLWEFPGGKVEPGESPQTALARELHEEIGVELTSSAPLFRVPWDYGDKWIDLDVHCCTYTGTPHGRESQALSWHAIDALDEVAMPAADRPVIAALRLPREYAITPEPGDDHEAFVDHFEAMLSRGVRLVQLRAKHADLQTLEHLARTCLGRAREHGAKILINDAPALCNALGLDGVHVSATTAAALESRPVARHRWFAVSCHDEAELAHARKIDADFVTLSPVAATASHPDALPLGWARVAELLRDYPLPAYVLGGLDRGDLDRARESHAFGVAGIRAFWDA